MAKRMKGTVWCPWQAINTSSLILFIIHLNTVLICSEEVCYKNLNGQCPDNTCCNQDICDSIDDGFECCNDINEHDLCSNCPACSKTISQKI